ncbi:3-hydroxyacyl-CoA dehydrogenase NAD-binding domain-containing protein [Parasulfitobacter algicola]|uniref:Enoyl-CoA hydratase/isomerase family protein n=1 Tax=Parasulfitobacter algicola TaxID=2614809 RepID=A0ABX2IX57_9RHOB|nr:3-hydroxyacyl-CoA dehydrogenase NAD-binding domain-containing protein [Sulfitobacter algicola]NSX54996.1 enoyl-CoA hydratase/isomerase family protein [Sulfitobacter algicola]
MTAVRYELIDNIALLTIQNPPVNAASHAVRAALLNGLEKAEREAKAAVILGDGRTFVAGADINEFGKPPMAPILPDACNRIEASSLPVIAALHGTALGGGLELALSAHYRVAVPDTKVGLPEVTLGIMPGAGGTQRLPRLTGAEAALKIITTGRPISADEALKLSILDKIENGNPREIGLQYAQAILNDGKGPRPISAMPSPTTIDFDSWHAAALAKGKGQIAAATAVRAVQTACELPFFDGLKRERELFSNLMASPQRQGLIHAFFAERAVSKLPELEGVASRDIKQIGVIGGGTMGAGIATASLLSGFQVVLVERDENAAQKARSTVEKMLDGAVQRGKLSPETHAKITQDAFTTASDYTAISTADMIIEAVFENMGVKRDVFAALDKTAKPGAVLASNTSYLDINEIASSTKRPKDVIGLHFFSPAHVMKLLEIVVADATAPDVTATGFALAKRLRKVAVRAGVCDGFIGNRILAHYRMAVDNMVLDGASPYQVDRALTDFGMAMGPYAVSDLAGLDIGWATRKRKAPNRDPRERVPSFADRLCELGRFGRKTGRGYYIYPNQKEDPEVLQIISEERADQGITPRDFTDDEIQRRFMAAMVNEAARVVEDGIARRPLDVDVTMLFGYGFPRWRGGPMKWADMQGLDTVLHNIHTFAQDDDWFWQPAPLLEKLVTQGRTFDDLNKKAAL